MADNPFIVELAKILGEPGLNWDNGRSGLLKEKALCKARAAAAFMLKDFDKITAEMQDAGRAAVLEGNGFNWIYRAMLRARAREIGVEI